MKKIAASVVFCACVAGCIVSAYLDMMLLAVVCFIGGMGAYDEIGSKT